MRHFVRFVTIDMLMRMRLLSAEWLEVVDAFIDGKIESGVMMVVGGNDLSPEEARALEERRALVTQIIFLLNSMKVEDGVCWSAENLVVVEIPEGVESIGEAAFFRCSSLTTLSFPTTLTTVGISAFDCCSSLDNVDLLHTQLQEIGDYAFDSCNELKSMTIPDSLQTLGEYVFLNCSMLVPSRIEVNYDSDSEEEVEMPADATTEVIAHLRSLQSFYLRSFQSLEKIIK